MSDNPKETEKQMGKAIFISADCWLLVFDLLPPFQLGLGIATISRRFDRRVDEHFKRRKWKLDKLEIRCKIGQNGSNEMEIVNSNGKSLPIAQNPLPNKFIQFRGILITFIDHKVLTFLRHFHHFSAKCAKLRILTENVRVLEFVMLNIWPMFNDTIRVIHLNPVAFHQMRQLTSSILCNCPCLQMLFFFFDIWPEFPPDDSANASDGQVVVKWLLSPHPDNLTKMLTIKFYVNSAVDQWLATVEQIKEAFSIASSPVPFVIFAYFPPSLSSVVPFELTNEFTGEKLTLSQENENDFKLIRCPIAAGDEEKWEKEMNDFYNEQKNKTFEISIGYGGVDKDLLDAASTGQSVD